jgi:hypothetical protein
MIDDSLYLFQRGDHRKHLKKYIRSDALMISTGESMNTLLIHKSFQLIQSITKRNGSVNRSESLNLNVSLEMILEMNTPRVMRGI